MFLTMTVTMAPVADEYREAVARAVEQARLAQGLSKEEAARRAAVSSITWKRVEDGLRVQDAKLHQITSSLEIDIDPVRDWMVANGINRGVPPTQGRPPLAESGQVRAVVSFDELFEDWVESATEAMRLEVEYARRRDLSPAGARAELWATLANLGVPGDPRGPWVPPWAEEAAMMEAADWVREHGDSRDIIDGAGASEEPPTSEEPPFDLAARRGVPDTRVRDAQDADADVPDAEGPESGA